MNFKEFKNLVHKPKKEKMSGDKLYCFERNISVRLGWFIYKLFPFIKGNHVTFFSFLILLFVFLICFIKEFRDFTNITLIQLFLLYFISIIDKIDGEISRAKNYCTQKGIYYDYTVHFFYPFVFYFVIGNYFYRISGNEILFYLTILLSIFTICLISLRSTRLIIRDTIDKKNVDIKDFITRIKKKKKPLFFPLRLLFYLSFMIYAWTLFYYVIVIYISSFNFELSYLLYSFHIIYCLLLIGYNIFWKYPRKNLFKK